MPKVTIDRAGIENIPTTSGQPRAGFLPGSGAAQVNQAFTNLGQKVAGITQEIAAKRIAITEANYVSTMNTETVETIGRLQQEMQTNLDDPRGYTDALMEQIDDIHAEALKNAPSDRSRAQLQSIFTQKRKGYFTNSFRFENKAIADTTLARAGENINTIANEVFADPYSLKDRLNDITLIADAAGEVLSPDQHEMFKVKAGSQLITSHLNGLIRAGDYSTALSEVSSGQFKQFFTNEQLAKLEDGLKDDIARRERELDKISTQQYKQQLDTLDLQIFRGEAGLTDLNEMLNTGQFRTNKDYIDRVKQIQKINEKAVEDQGYIHRIDAALAGEAPLSPSSSDDRKAADTYYEKILAPQLTQEDGIERAVKFSTDLGIVPKKFKDQLTGHLNNGSNQGQIGAAQIIDGIAGQDSSAARSFTNKDISRARHIAGNINAGMTSEEAIKAADERMQADKGLLRRREDSLADAGIEFSPPTEFFRDDPNEVPDEMALDFDRLLNTFAVELGHSPEEAEAMANKRIEALWHVSNVNGDPEYMKNSPEKLFNPRGVDPKWIRKQLVSEMEQLGLGESFTRIIPNHLANPDTMEYFVMEEIDGVEVQALDSNGDPITWYPDYKTYTEGK